MHKPRASAWGREHISPVASERHFVLSSFVTILLLFLLASCSNSPRDITKADTLPLIFPDYTGVTIPADIAPLNFSV
ncbi:MAG: hypothetical protein K2G13_08060, partial [Muribaculaceae bacterium]|nr:hypothetical protein [Muribaculaceae bacterium]